MSVLRRNLLFNFLGRGWSALMGLAFVPLYVHFLGIESYGLVGFFATVQGFLALLDLGLGAALNRELARLSAQPGEAQRMRDLVRTLESIYFGVALLIGVVLVALSPLIARHWVQAESLPVESVARAVALLGLTLALQWPYGFHSGGLMGLQRQVLYNVIHVGVASARGIGAVLVLWLVSPTIEAFFAWQALVAALGTATMASALWSCLPAGERRARFTRPVLRSVWRFAAGMTGITAAALLLTHADKLLLSRLLSLETFGYYSLASVVAGALYYLVGPIFMALFPRFSQLVSAGDERELTALYHRSCQLMAVVILPVAVTISLFSFEVLSLWTRDPEVSERTHLLVSILILGTALNGLMNLPYALQLAYGWTRLTLVTNIVAVIVLIPTLIAMTLRYGATGAALVWVVLNLGYVLIAIQIMHRRLLRTEKWRWYGEDVGLPLAATLVVCSLGRWLLPAQAGELTTLFWLGGVGALATVAALLCAPRAAEQVWRSFAQWAKSRSG